MFNKLISFFIVLLLFVMQACNAPIKNKTKDETTWSKQTNIYEVNLRQYTASARLQTLQKAFHA